MQMVGGDTMNIQLSMNMDEGKDRVKEAKLKKKAASYCPTLEEVFITGWTNARGTFKKPIKDLKNCDTD